MCIINVEQAHELIALKLYKSYRCALPPPPPPDRVNTSHTPRYAVVSPHRVCTTVPITILLFNNYNRRVINVLRYLFAIATPLSFKATGNTSPVNNKARESSFARYMCVYVCVARAHISMFIISVLRVRIAYVSRARHATSSLDKIPARIRDKTSSLCSRDTLGPRETR